MPVAVERSLRQAAQRASQVNQIEADESVVAFLLRAAKQLDPDQGVVEVWMTVLVEAAVALSQ